MDDTRAKRTKPIPCGETEEQYRVVMRKIMEGLTKENLEMTLFLCKDYIPHGREITTALQLLKYLEDRDFVSQDSAVFIAEVLHIIRRMDLLKIIPCIKDKKHFEKEFLALSYYSFSNYRVLTVKLQEELSQRDFETFRHQCGQHLNTRSLEEATNVLSLLRKLEEEDVISPDSYDDLITILECIENVKPLKMFQRLIDGDESVAVPAGKQSRKNNPEGNNPGPGDFIRPRSGQWSNGSRVERRPNENHPPQYHAYPGTLEFSDTKEKQHEDEKTVHYDFDTRGHPVLTRNNTRCFEGDEVTPKRLVDATAQPNVQYQSMPPPYAPQDHHRHHSDNSDVMSMPGMRYVASQPHYREHHHPQFSMPHAMTYPHHLQEAPGRYNYPVQQQQSYDLTRHSEYGAVPRQYPTVELRQFVPYSTMPMMAPPRDYLVAETEAKMRKLTVGSVKNEIEGRIMLDGKETLPNKATVNLSEETSTVQKAGPSPDHERQMEELRKRNEELENFLKDQRNLGSYKMDASPVGLCLLINNVNFEENRKIDEYHRRCEVNSKIENPADRYTLPRIDLQNRVGSDVDADKLEKLFTCFDFEVCRHNDLDERGIRRVTRETGMMDHSKYDCFLLIVLSHGDIGCVFGVDGFRVDTADIQKPFFANNCKSLANKPKILIFQACQGNKAMPSVAPEADLINHDGPQPENLADNSTPCKADFLLAYATVPGYISYRSRVAGSFFVMEAVDIFRKHYQHEDLLSMMIMVNNEVAKKVYKQVPLPMPTLRKKVFFHLKEGCTSDDLADEEIEEYLDEEQGSLTPPGAVGGSAIQSLATIEERISTQESGEQYE